QRRGFRPHAPAHLAQREPVLARVQRNAPRVLDEREALVIDRYGDRLLVGQRARLFHHRGASLRGDRERRGDRGGHRLALHGISPCSLDGIASPGAYERRRPQKGLKPYSALMPASFTTLPQVSY